MSFRIALAQINPTVGDFEGNKKKVITLIRRGREEDAKLVIFPELVLTGYPPKDLLHNKKFLEENREVLEDIIKETEGIGAVVGFVDFYKGESSGNVYDISSPFPQRRLVLHNTACLIQNCKIIGKVYKVHLPNYDVFDEKRYFTPGRESPIFEFEGEKIGINICEDIWFDNGPLEEQVKKGADLIINISASPYYAGKRKIRRNIISKKAQKNNVPVIFVNMVGGQDDMIFDGSSYVFNDEGKLILKGKSFNEDFLVIDLFDGEEITCEENVIKNVFDTLVLGTRDYVRKNGFEKVVIGLSGGIDSAITAVIACEALGKENVLALLLPGPYSSKGSIDDAVKLSKNLEIEYRIIEINRIYQEYLCTLNEHFKGLESDVTEENIQARIRGNILMAFSNKFHSIVLSTGNNSELAVGYSTLYGDMAGGLAVISDVPKTLVYRLADYYNEMKEKKIIPNEIISKTPSAELRDNQKDSDDLPPYDILDEILDMYLEKGLGFGEIVKKGFDKSIVSDILKRINRNEYKRKQAPIGLKITQKSFGFGRRMPITNRFMQ
ncbi:NAD+ synthase [candidate division WOR-3 bacterium]|nr:NAD+ synthase [candidate division WOR-3 bacterium]